MKSMCKRGERLEERERVGVGGGITQPFRQRQRQFDKSTNKTNKRSHFPPHAHVCAKSANILSAPGNAPLPERERECERERSSDCDADADSDTVVNRMTAPNNKVISSPNKTSARAPTRKAKAVRAGQQVRTSQRAGLRQCVCETERECSDELKPVRFEVGYALVVLR